MTDNLSDKYEQETKQASRNVTWALAGIGVAWLVFAIIAAIYGNLPRQSGVGFFSGVFGDTFGALTALFTGLALAGIWYTTRLQKIELKATREELKKQADSMALQVSHLERQSFENTFFQLLRRYGDAVQTCTFPHGSTNRHGTDALMMVFGYLKRFWQENLQAHERSTSKDRLRELHLQIASKAMQQVLEEFGPRILHLYRILVHLLRFIDGSALQPPEKLEYGKTVGAQLSDAELILLFYVCSVREDQAELRALVKRYSVLGHVPMSMLLHASHESDPSFG